MSKNEKVTDFNKRLEELKIELPPIEPPIASYISVKIVDDYVWVSGTLPFENGRLYRRGLFGENVYPEDGVKCAEIAVLNILSNLKTELGDLNKIESFVKISGFVASVPDFLDHHKVIDGASNLLIKIFGIDGKHSREVVGVSSLPLRSPLEISAIIKLKEKFESIKVEK
jgi:enamine deaminase RidA (YjgF/YER057c/UK114 family)